MHKIVKIGNSTAITGRPPLLVGKTCRAPGEGINFIHHILERSYTDDGEIVEVEETNLHR